MDTCLSSYLLLLSSIICKIKKKHNDNFYIVFLFLGLSSVCHHCRQQPNKSDILRTIDWSMVILFSVLGSYKFIKYPLWFIVGFICFVIKIVTKYIKNHHKRVLIHSIMHYLVAVMCIYITFVKN